MSRAKSINVEELNKVAAEAARSAVGDDLKRFGSGASIGVFPDIGTIGLIWRDPDLRDLNAGELLDISTKIAGELRSIAGDGQPVCNIFDGGVIAGYFPANPVVTQELF